MLAGFEVHEKLMAFHGIIVGEEGVAVDKLRMGFAVGVLSSNALLTSASVYLLEVPFVDKSVTLLSILMSALGSIKLGVVCLRRSDFAAVLTQCSGHRKRQLGIEKTEYYLNRLYMVTAGIIIVLWSLPSLFYKETVLPIPYWFPFDVNSGLGFACAYSYIVTALVYIASSNLSVDSTFLTASVRICLKLSVLAKKFKGLVTASDRKKAIGECVVDHMIILRLINQLKAIMSPIYFIAVIELTVTCCISVFAITKIDLSVFELLKCVPVITYSYMNLFMYCWIGEQIFSYNTKLHFAVYSSQWETFSVRDRRSLHTIQVFTARDVVMTGCTIFTMSLNTFQRAVREAFSYLTILRSLTA